MKLPFDLLEVKSSLEYLCLDASERGEMGDRSTFSFLFIGIAKLLMFMLQWFADKVLLAEVVSREELSFSPWAFLTSL